MVKPAFWEGLRQTGELSRNIASIDDGSLQKRVVVDESGGIAEAGVGEQHKGGKFQIRRLRGTVKLGCGLFIGACIAGHDERRPIKESGIEEKCGRPSEQGTADGRAETGGDQCAGQNHNQKWCGSRRIAGLQFKAIINV